MTVATGSFSNNEVQIYNYLTSSMGLNNAAACGILANFYQESGFNPRNLQNAYESSLGYNDVTYTNAVDNGRYTNFIKDSAGYGLAQWTWWTFKRDLYNYAKSNRGSVGALAIQLGFLKSSMNTTSYSSLLSYLMRLNNTPADAEKAAKEFCSVYEKPANLATKMIERGNLAKGAFWTAYGTGSSSSVYYTNNIGKEIVEIARSKKGSPFFFGGSGPITFDAAGLVYYSYREAGYFITKQSSQSYYNTYKKTGKTITGNPAAGDLLFYSTNKSTVSSIAIANGEGGRIYADNVLGVVEREGLGNPTYILRILSDSETESLTESGVGGDSTIVEDFTSLTTIDIYAQEIIDNLSRVEAVGFDYGYLIDLTHGDEFKFYIPEFSESAGANWESINILGRSVSIKAYSSTESRSIAISLDLYAGVGLYKGTSTSDFEPMMAKLHKDANFLKSLEYPDYENPVIRPPSTVQLILGSAINLIGIVSDVTVEHMKPFDEHNRAIYLKVSFKVTQIATNPPDWKDIREGVYTITSTENNDSINTSDNITNAPVFTANGKVSSVNEADYIEEGVSYK